MDYQYKVSVAICSYNRARFIVDALESVFNQDFDKRLYEVVVVDNNSTDNVLEVLAKYKADHPNYNLRYFTELNQGVAFTRTRLAKEALGEIVAYIDDDATAEPGWLKETVKFYDEHNDVYSIGGKIIPRMLVAIPDWYSNYLSGLIGSYDLGKKVMQMKGAKYPCGANMSFRKKVFDEVGYFNTDLGRKGTGLLATEEKDIYLRILKEGHKVYYLPQVAVRHSTEGIKFDKKYFHRYSMGIGGGERVMLKGQPTALIKKFLEYLAKWIYVLIYGVGFLVKGQFSKFIMLERFRWWIMMGFLNPAGAEKL